MYNYSKIIQNIYEKWINKNNIKINKEYIKYIFYIIFGFLNNNMLYSEKKKIMRRNIYNITDWGAIE